MNAKHQFKRQRLPDFDARSVMLIAAWALGGSAAVQAQTPAPPPAQAPMTAPAAQGTGGASPADAAFKRMDKDGDGKLTRTEAAADRALSERFDAIDTDGDGAISAAEFDQARMKK